MFFITFLLLLFTQDPSSYVAEDNSYRIWQPGPFEEISEEIETDVGILDVFTLVSNPEDIEEEKNFLYLLNYTEYPQDLEIQDSLGLQLQMVENTIADILSSYDGNLIYQSKLEKLNGHLFRMSYGEGGYIAKGKVFFLDNRVYMIQVHCTKDKSLNTRMDRFLDSFAKI